MTARPEVLDLVAMGSFPPSDCIVVERLQRQEALLRDIVPPISDEEARLLVKILGPDEYFGLAWTVLHLVEGSPGWPIEDCLNK